MGADLGRENGVAGRCSEVIKRPVRIRAYGPGYSLCDDTGDWIASGMSLEDAREIRVAVNATVPPDLLRAALWALVWLEACPVFDEWKAHQDAMRALGEAGVFGRMAGQPVFLARAREALRMLPEEAKAGDE